MPVRRGRDAQLVEALFGPVVRTTDLRYTPVATIEALFDSDPPPRGCILDPCAGDGRICAIAHTRGYEALAVEIREEERAALSENLGGCEHVDIGDWLQLCEGPWNVQSVITNPPFSIARDIAEACFKVEPYYLALLLRCNTIGSRPWRSFWRAHPPTRIRPVKRPAFATPEHEAEGTDASEYAFFIWVAGEPPINLKPI